MRVTTRDMTLAGLKVLGVVVALHTGQAMLRWFWTRSLALEGGMMRSELGFWALSIALQAGVAVLLLFRTELLCGWLLGGRADDEAEVGCPKELVAAGLMIAGCVVALLAFPHVVSAAVEAVWLLGAERREVYKARLEEHGLQSVYWVTSCVVGLWVARRSGLVLGLASREPKARAE